MRFGNRLPILLLAITFGSALEVSAQTTIRRESGKVFIVSTATDALCVGATSGATPTCSGGISTGTVTVSPPAANKGIVIQAAPSPADNLFRVNDSGVVPRVRIDQSFDFYVRASGGSDVFSVLSASGNTTVAGTMGVTGAATFSGNVLVPNTGLQINDTDASHRLSIVPGSNLTAARTLTLTTGDAARTITLTGNPTLADWFDQDVKIAAAPQFAGMTLTGNLSSLSGAGFVGLTVSGSGGAAGFLSMPIIGTGTGALTGNVVGIGNRSAGSGAAGLLKLFDKASTAQFIWVDAAGNVRISTAAPEEDGTPSDTSGTVVGTQTSQRALKNIHGEFTDYDAALRTILQTPVFDFDYKSGAYNQQRFVGITTDDSPIFGMDQGRSFNPVTAFGYTVAAFKAQQDMIDALRLRIAALERGKKK